MDKKSQKTQPRANNILKITLALIFVISAVLSYFFLPLRRIVTDPQIINASLTNQNIYGLLSDNSFEFIQKIGTFQNETGRVDPAFTSRIISRVLSPNWWKAGIFRYLDEYYKFLKNGILENNPSISFTSLKGILQNRNDEIIISEEINTYIKCTEDQNQNIISIMNDDSGTIPMCMIDDSLAIPFVGFLQSQLARLGNGIPVEYRFDTKINNSLIQDIKIIRSIYFASLISIILALSLFSALTITLAKDLQKYLRWMGKLLTITGFVGILFDLLFFLASNSIVSDSFQMLVSEFPPVLLQPLTKAMLQVSTVLIFYYGLLPVATAAIGLIFLVLVRVFYIKKADV
jgi:hypothetical protein